MTFFKKIKQEFKFEKLLLLTGLHQFNEVSEEDVAVAVAESVHLVADFTGVVVDHKARLPRLKVLVVAHGGAQFLFLEINNIQIISFSGAIPKKSIFTEMISTFLSAKRLRNRMR